tara:strand:+ start:414 stop:896 length:483 start_codon:yes stop_codon:yes gene_type:complete
MFTLPDILVVLVMGDYDTLVRCFGKPIPGYKEGKMTDQFCLVSTSGDMSARGMTDKNTVYKFDDCHKKSVDDFLRKQLEKTLYSFSSESSEDLKNHDYKKWEKVRGEYENGYMKLRDLGIFTCKWDGRTRWNLAHFSEDELEPYEPYVVSKQHEGINGEV